MHVDPAIPIFVASIFSIAFLLILMRRFKQSHVIVYLIAGIVLGPQILGIITDTDLMNRAGSLGIVFLLFFIGMECSPKRLAQNWFISVFGTLGQIGVSLLVISILGLFLDWSFSRIVFLGFVISLSSTAVVLKLLEDWKELDTRVGQDALGILLVQDLLIVPMVITLELLGSHTLSYSALLFQILGGVLLSILIIWLVSIDEIKIPWVHHLEKDHEMQLFIALSICFGMAMVTGLLGLSAPLGAFVGGMMVSSARQTHWVHQSLSSLRTVFMAIFFVSIGMMVDLNFLLSHLFQVTFLVIAAILTNTLINASILRTLGTKWNASIYGGSLLSQIGEFSFLLAALGLQIGLVNHIGYQMTISVISMTLVVSPLWIKLMKSVTNMEQTKLKLM